MKDELPQPVDPVRRPVRRWLITGVGFLLLAAVFPLVFSGDELASLRRLSVPVLVSTLLLQVVAQLLFNSVFLMPLRSHLPQLGFWELFLVRTGGMVAASVVPVAGGLAVRMAYLKRQGLTYGDFATATVVSNITTLLAVGPLTASAIALYWMLSGPPAPAVLGMTGAVIAVVIAAVAVYRLLPRVRSHPWVTARPMLATIAGNQIDERTMPRILTISFVRHVVNFLTFGLLYYSVSGAARGLMAGGLVYAITSPVRMLQITPGNIGVNEWVVGLVGRMIAFEVADGLLVALLFRGLGMAAQGLGLVIAMTQMPRGERVRAGR